MRNRPPNRENLSLKGAGGRPAHWAWVAALLGRLIIDIQYFKIEVQFFFGGDSFHCTASTLLKFDQPVAL